MHKESSILIDDYFTTGNKFDQVQININILCDKRGDYIGPLLCEIIKSIEKNLKDKNRMQSYTQLLLDLYVHKLIPDGILETGFQYYLDTIEDEWWAEDFPLLGNTIGMLLAPLFIINAIDPLIFLNKVQDDHNLINSGHAEKIVGSLLKAVKEQQGEEATLKLISKYPAGLRPFLYGKFGTLQRFMEKYDLAFLEQDDSSAG